VTAGAMSGASACASGYAWASVELRTGGPRARCGPAHARQAASKRTHLALALGLLGQGDLRAQRARGINPTLLGQKSDAVGHKSVLPPCRRAAELASPPPHLLILARVQARRAHEGRGPADPDEVEAVACGADSGRRGGGRCVEGGGGEGRGICTASGVRDDHWHRSTCQRAGSTTQGPLHTRPRGNMHHARGTTPASREPVRRAPFTCGQGFELALLCRLEAGARQGGVARVRENHARVLPALPAVQRVLQGQLGGRRGRDQEKKGRNRHRQGPAGEVAHGRARAGRHGRGVGVSWLCGEIGGG
jgi:hypothetical protein